MREGPGTERLGMAQRRTTLPVLAEEWSECGQALGGQGCLRPDGEPGEESMVGLPGGNTAEDGSILSKEQLAWQGPGAAASDPA